MESHEAILVDNIIDVITKQNVIIIKLNNLQKQANELQTTANTLSGKLEGLFDIYKQMTGKNFLDNINVDQNLKSRVMEAQHRAMKIVESEGNEEQADIKQSPKLKKVEGNKKVQHPGKDKPSIEVEQPTDQPHVVNRTKVPPPIVINEEPVSAEDLKNSKDDE